MVEPTYLIRYGVMGRVGQFRGLPGCGGPFDRGRAVVIQSHRGMELGEVLLRLDDETAARGRWDGVEPPADEDASPTEADVPHVLRAASSEDLARAEMASDSRSSRFNRCQGVLDEAGWPWELLDVEPLFDGHATVLHYLGPLQPDLATVRARFRIACDFDIVLEPVGSDAAGDESEELEPELAYGDGCGSGGCGSGGCGSGGGCGVAVSSSRGSATQSAQTGRADEESTHHGGCASCGISQWKAARRRDPSSSN